MPNSKDTTIKNDVAKTPSGHADKNDVAGDPRDVRAQDALVRHIHIASAFRVRIDVTVWYVEPYQDRAKKKSPCCAL
jgi:hypothetical protein